MLTTTHLKAMDDRSPACGEREDGGIVASIEDLPTDVIALVLRRLDGASLASVGCACSGLHALATDPDIWRGLCLAMWPSVCDVCFCDNYRAFFADAFPFPAGSPTKSASDSLPSQLVSAVDLRHKGVSIMSRVIETDTSSAWFLGSPFRIDALVQEGFTAPSPITLTELKLSWILLDPVIGRAVNVSSRCPVSVDRKWLTGDTMVRFTIVFGDVAMEAAVTFDDRHAHVREVSLCIEDSDGGGVSGCDGMAVVTAAMLSERQGVGKEETARRRYEEFVKGKRASKERKARREGIVDLCCSSIGAAAFLSFLMMLTFR